jgi:hypothetical protein
MALTITDTISRGDRTKQLGRRARPGNPGALGRIRDPEPGHHPPPEPRPRHEPAGQTARRHRHRTRGRGQSCPPAASMTSVTTTSVIFSCAAGSPPPRARSWTRTVRATTSRDGRAVFFLKSL